MATSKWNTPELQPFIVQDVRPTGKILGEGSFGSVEEAEIPGALCVVKKLHEALQPHPSEAHGADRMATTFVGECRLMSTLHHPHIVQFLGVCFLPKAKLPALVMEKLLTDLHNLLESNPDIPLCLKHVILLGVARGLVYLHSRNPPVIHRDLTARNVLLNSAMEAKIADLGNFRTIQPNQSKTMTKNPGNMWYMPPEAQDDIARYNTAVDIFSFGHLSLFTLAQKFPDVKAATYSAGFRRIVARSEVDRRVETFKLANKILGAHHPLVQLTKDCLSNAPEDRPAVSAILERLEQVKTYDNELAFENKLRMMQAYKSVEQRNVALSKTLDEQQKQIEAQQRQLDEMQTNLSSAQQQAEDSSRELKQKNAVIKSYEENQMQQQKDAVTSKTEMYRIFHDVRDLQKKISDKLLEAENLQESSFETQQQQIQGEETPSEISPKYVPPNEPTRQRKVHPLPVSQDVPYQKPLLPRSISQTNLDTTKRCRAVIQQDREASAPVGGTNFFTITPSFTLTLPPLEGYSREFKQFVFDRIIDKETQRCLEDEKCLNWCESATKLVPIYTMGDGNCLLHAASLGMWGFQDRDNILRRSVSHAVLNHQGNTFYRRWKYARDVDNQQSGIQLDDHQWQEEWDLIVKQASPDVNDGANLDSLEEYHVFVLANILRRPIIMYASPKMRSVYGSTLQRQNFHGVYLPLLWDPDSCKRDPLPLAFYGGHFSSLVVIESPEQYKNGFLVLPLTDIYGQQLPVRFTVPQEDPTSLLMDYLQLLQVEKHNSPYISRSSIACAKLSIPEAPAYFKPLIDGFIEACNYAYTAMQPPQAHSLFKQYQTQSSSGSWLDNIKCPHCTNPGHPMYLTMCEDCYRERTTGGGSGGGSQRILCCTAGCSFKGYTDLGGYCPDCYQRNGHNAPDPNIYPLV